MAEAQTTGTAVVIGGGIGGLCTGIALGQTGWKVEVYEAVPALGEVGAGLSLWPNALKALDRLGLGDDVRALGVADIAGGGIEDRHGRPLMGSSMSDVVARFGAPTVVVHRAELQALLVERLGRDRLHLGVRCSGFSADSSGTVTAHLSAGRTATADLLVGADGIRSAIRQQLWPDAEARYSGYASWRGVTAFDHARVPSWGESWGYGHRFGITPLSGGRVYWFATRNAPPHGEPPGTSALARQAELRKLFGGWHVPIPALIEATDPAVILRNDIEYLDPLPHWSAGSVTLLGDAAHAMTPDLGQGACQAIEDAVALGVCLRGAPDIAAAIERYEAMRRPRANRIMTTSRRLGRVAQWSSPLACGLRDRGLRLLPPDTQLRQLAPIIGYEVPAE